MDVDKLAKMADQIATNFYYGPNKAQAVASVADHILRFWTAGMRAELAEGHASGRVALGEVAALALATASRPGAAPQMADTGGDAG
jgi:hypothetical protein